MRKGISLFVILLVLMSCSSDDGSINPELGEKWVLQNVVCFCFFGDDFDFTNHSLTFNDANGTVLIANSEQTPFIAPEGTYSYSDNGEIIEIDGKQFTYEIKDDTLTLYFVDEPLIADDEITYFYTKG
ncbi:hypothetical protein [Flagellimonas sp. 2504JD4-2]